MTQEQKENLLKLADYLESGNLKAKFDMAIIYDTSKCDGINDCGTVGCALGHGPYAGIPKPLQESWIQYSYNAFGMEWGTNEFKQLFGSQWEAIDNTPEGAAKRIRAELAKH